GLWFVSEGTLPTYTVEEVLHGLEKHDNILVRTQTLTEEGHKTVLTRAESIKQLKENGKAVVEGANLHVNEYGSPLFADFFFFIT
ncbi:cytochrome oxidase subunit III, partial [Seonamhaeicola marinus]